MAPNPADDAAHGTTSLFPDEDSRGLFAGGGKGGAATCRFAAFLWELLAWQPACMWEDLGCHFLEQKIILEPQAAILWGSIMVYLFQDLTSNIFEHL